MLLSKLISQCIDLGDVQIGMNVESDNEMLDAISPQPLEPQKCIVRVHRLNVKSDMINIFRDPSIMNCVLEAVVIDCMGY